jgi:predicted ester cyclase
MAEVSSSKIVVLRHLNEAIANKRFNIWNEIMHEDYVLHHPLVRGGRDGYREASEAFWSAFGDASYEIHHLVAEGDYVMAHYTERATQVAPIFGVEPGRSYEKPGFALYRFEDGKMREAWVQEDDQAFKQQLGIVEMEHLS